MKDSSMILAWIFVPLGIFILISAVVFPVRIDHKVPGTVLASEFYTNDYGLTAVSIKYVYFYREVRYEGNDQLPLTSMHQHEVMTGAGIPVFIDSSSPSTSSLSANFATSLPGRLIAGSLCVAFGITVFLGRLK